MDKKTALVTGAGRGIGRAIALELARLGHAVCVNYKANAEAAADTVERIRAAGGDAFAVQADVADEADRARLLDAAYTQWGRLDLLVNNAGMAPRVRADLLEMTAASYREVMATNLEGPFFLTQAAARRMIAAGPGERMIINIGSISADTVSLNRGEYCLAKAGVAMMTQLFAARLAEHGIAVFEVRPGIIATDMTAAVQGKYQALIDGGLLPIRRMGQPEDVAKAVGMIAQGALPYSTGEVIRVDGGFYLRRL